MQTPNPTLFPPGLENHKELVGRPAGWPAGRLAGRPVGQPAGYSFIYWLGFIKFAQPKELGQPKAKTGHETHVFYIENSPFLGKNGKPICFLTPVREWTPPPSARSTSC